MKVYRLEYEDRGIFAGSNWWFNNIGSEVLNHSDHPVIGDDTGILEAFEESGNFKQYPEQCVQSAVYTEKEGEECLFGFVSIPQMLRWMYDKSWRVVMVEAGVQLKVYEVPSEWVLVGNTQVVFKEREAVHVETLPIPV